MNSNDCKNPCEKKRDLWAFLTENSLLLTRVVIFLLCNIITHYVAKEDLSALACLRRRSNKSRLHSINPLRQIFVARWARFPVGLTRQVFVRTVVYTVYKLSKTIIQERKKIMLKKLTALALSLVFVFLLGLISKGNRIIKNNLYNIMILI